MTDSLTPDQRELWDELRARVPLNAGQDPLGVASSFQAACQLEGVEPPSRDAVLSVLREDEAA